MMTPGREEGRRGRRGEENDTGKLIMELYSLGIEVKSNKVYQINDKEELEVLVDNLKQSMIQDYRIAFSRIGDNHEEEAKSTVSV
jgi:hypothetical protein